MKKYIPLILLSFSVALCAAQQWKNYTNSETINCIVADHDTLWVGTQGGVSKFLLDGTKLANYTHADGLASNNVRGIAIDHLGNKWFASGTFTDHGDYGGGVSKFDGTNWTNFDSTNSNLISSSITGIVIDTQNQVWVSMQANGIAKYDGVSWTNYNMLNSILPGNYVSNLKLDKLGNIWMTCYSSSGDFVKITGATWSRVTRPNGVGATAIAFDNQNNLWTCWGYSQPGSQSGLAKYDGSNWTTYSPPLNTMAMAIDTQNNKWFCDGNSFWKFDGNNWTRYTSPMGAIWSPYIVTLFIDSLNNKWFGTSLIQYPGLGNGLGRFDGTSWSLYKCSEGEMPGNSVYTMATDHHGNKFISAFSESGTGLVKFDGSQWDSLGAFYPTLSAVDKEDRIWFGLSSYDGTNWNYLPNPDNISPYRMLVDLDNNKWFGTGWGVHKFDGVNWYAYDSTNCGLVNNNIGALATDLQGNVWFGTYRGVSKFDGANWTSYTTGNSGLIDNSINSMAVDLDGSIWFGTKKGVSKFDGNNWTTYDELNSGLAGNCVWAIAIDKAGYKWFAMTDISYRGKGVTSFDGTTWKTYTSFNSGLSSNSINSIVVDDSNNKWFTSSEGVSELMGNDSRFTAWARFNGNICSSGAITLNPVVNNGTPPYTFSWQSNNNSLSCNNCQNPTANITQNTVFTLRVTDANNETTADTLHVYYCGYTGLTETSATKPDFTLFPNPTTGRLNINPGVMQILSIQIYNATGQLILESKLPQTSGIDVSQLASGLYIAEVRTKDFLMRKKWIKK